MAKKRRLNAFFFTKIGQMSLVESRDRHCDGDLKSINQSNENNIWEVNPENLAVLSFHAIIIHKGILVVFHGKNLVYIRHTFRFLFMVY